MPRRTEMERARRWGRALNTVDRAPDRLFVDGEAVWRVDDPAQTGSWLVGALDTAPSGGVSVGPADGVRLRDAVTALERARDLPSLLTKGLPPLARFRDVDIDQLLQAGHRRLGCLSWATSDPAIRPTSPPLRVLTPALPRDLRSMLRHARIALPPLPHHLTPDLSDQDLTIAARLAQWDLAGVAESWLRTAAAVWWPPSIHIETVDGFFEQLVGRPSDAVSIARAARSYATREGFYGTVPAGLSDLNDIRAALHALLDSGSDEDAQAWRPPCIELHLAGPTIPGLSSACRPDRVGAAAQALRAVVSNTWREQVGPAVPAVLEEHWFPQWVTNLPATLAARVLAQWPVPDISWDHRLLDRYLRLLEDRPRTDSEEGRFLRTRVAAKLCNTTAEWARLGGLAGLDVSGMEDLEAIDELLADAQVRAEFQLDEYAPDTPAWVENLLIVELACNAGRRDFIGMLCRAAPLMDRMERTAIAVSARAKVTPVVAAALPELSPAEVATLVRDCTDGPDASWLSLEN